MVVSPKTKAVLLQWDSYKELQTRVLLHSAFPLCMWLHFRTTIPSNNYDRPKTTGECGMF